MLILLQWGNKGVSVHHNSTVVITVGALSNQSQFFFSIISKSKIPPSHYFNVLFAWSYLKVNANAICWRTNLPDAPQTEGWFIVVPSMYILYFIAGLFAMFSNYTKTPPKCCSAIRHLYHCGEIISPSCCWNAAKLFGGNICWTTVILLENIATDFLSLLMQSAN